MERTDHGLIDNWLRPVNDLYHHHSEELEGLEEAPRWDRLCELNVIDQVRGVAYSTVLQKAGQRGQEVAVHGWVYRLSNGLIHDLGVEVSFPEQVPSVYRITSSSRGARASERRGGPLENAHLGRGNQAQQWARCVG